MDATRVDLSQLDEGRSVPSTPLTTTPPTISITEPPSQDTEPQTQDLLTAGETALQLDTQTRYSLNLLNLINLSVVNMKLQWYLEISFSCTSKNIEKD